MFDNIGRKIKGLVKIFFWLQIILYFAIAFFLFIAYSGNLFLVLLGVALIVIGGLIAWFSLLFSYAFGELVDQTTMNRRINQDNNALLKYYFTNQFQQAGNHTSSSSNYFCPACGMRIEAYPCPYCGEGANPQYSQLYRPNSKNQL